MLRIVIVAFICLAPVCAGAADARLKLPSFAALERKAKESVDITIGAFPLRMVGRLMSGDDPESAALKRMVIGLQAIVVRSYTFDSDQAYSKADVDAVRTQLSNPLWNRLATVRNKKDNDDVDIFIAYEGDKIAGLAIIASGPREFSIVNIVGEVGIEQVAALQKQFNLPQSGATRMVVPLL